MSNKVFDVFGLDAVGELDALNFRLDNREVSNDLEETCLSVQKDEPLCFLTFHLRDR